MWVSVAIYLLGAVGLVLAWYVWFSSDNRRRSLQVLRWLEQALAGQGQVTGFRWLNSSRFQVPLRMAAPVFQHASIVVQMPPRENPLNWLLSSLRRQPATLTFQADLELPPAFSLKVQNHRWYARTRKKMSLDPRHWVFERTAPFVLSTRRDWERELSGMVSALAASRQQDFIRISFQRTSPHLVATVPLEAISPGAAAPEETFAVIRELAGSVSASRS